MTWDRTKLQELPTVGSVIAAGDERIKTYSEDTMMTGHPDAVLIARDAKEIAEVLAFCDGHRIPVTLCGSQTSMTGASVPQEGLLISTEKLEGPVDIVEEDGETLVVTEPGMITADLQRAVAEAGHFYPVAPTSRDECRVGGNVATNATGEDSFKYGPVRRYVKRLEIVLPDGERRTLERKPGDAINDERNRAGYLVDWTNPIDLIIGSEGTLAFVSRIWLKLLPQVPSFFSALIPMPSNETALNLVVEIASGKTPIAPRTLELVDSGALQMMKTAEGFPAIPDTVAAFLYIKQEYANEAERDSWLERWYEAVLPHVGEELIDHLLVAMTPTEQEQFRLWRHRIPEAANEHGREYWAAGGGKIGSDWWVPIDRLVEMMHFFYDVANASTLPWMGYAHIGNGHPHTNLLAKTAEERARAHDVLIQCCRKAVALGGGVAGEHGVGKIHTDFMPIQHAPEVIERMRTWKRQYDPHLILGRGNLFPE